MAQEPDVQTAATPAVDPALLVRPHSPSFGPEDAPVTLVEFLLQPVADGTRITLRESGFAALPESVRGTATEENIGGWAEEMDHLAAYLNGETQG